jgi:hypothetical protein
MEHFDRMQRFSYAAVAVKTSILLALVTSPRQNENPTVNAAMIASRLTILVTEYNIAIPATGNPHAMLVDRMEAILEIPAWE